MEKLLKQYEETIDKMESRISELRAELKKERNLERLHKLEWRIELLREERLDLIYICRHIREYLAPKSDNLPSLRYKKVSGED